MDIRLGGALGLALATSGLLGCVAPSLGGPLTIIDPRSQACVDGALQRNPDRAVLGEAVIRFERGCRAGDPAACSLLGVMHERGLALPQDSTKAIALYERACNAGNLLGCTHLTRSTVLLPGIEAPPATPAMAGR